MNEGGGKAGGIIEFLDFGFTKFITLKAIKILYALGLILLVLAWLGLSLAAMVSGEIVVGIVVLLFGPIGVVVYALLFRIQLELIAVIFRIGENTTKLVQMGEMKG